MVYGEGLLRELVEVEEALLCDELVESRSNVGRIVPVAFRDSRASYFLITIINNFAVVILMIFLVV